MLRGRRVRRPISQPSRGPSWRGLRVVERRLEYRPPSLQWRRPVLRLRPDGLAVVAASGETERLPWETRGQAWDLYGVIPTRMNRGGIQVTISREPGAPYPHTVDRRGVWLPSTWSSPPLVELPAFAQYLSATPQARSSLANEDGLYRLIEALSTKTWMRPGPPGEPLLGDRLDVHVATIRALDAASWRRFGGRPVRGEWAPAADDIAARASTLLSRAAASRVNDEQLLAAARRHLDTAPWPFDVLT